jgi:hypothetical protein
MVGQDPAAGPRSSVSAAITHQSVGAAVVTSLGLAQLVKRLFFRFHPLVGFTARESQAGTAPTAAG